MCSGICPPSKPLRHLVAGLGALGATTGGLALASPHHDRRGSWRSWHPGRDAGGAPSARRARAALGGLRGRLCAAAPWAVSLGHVSSLLDGFARRLPCRQPLVDLLDLHQVATSDVATVCGPRTTTSPMRFRPRLRSVSRWFCFSPISGLDLGHLERAAITHLPSPLRQPAASARSSAAGATSSKARPRRAATARGSSSCLQGRDRRVHDVDRVRRTERLAQDVVDAGALEHGAHRTTGDDTGTGSGRTQQDDTGSGLTLDGVRDGARTRGTRKKFFLASSTPFEIAGGHLAGLAVADADDAVAVADDDERGEAEATTTLDDLGRRG